MAIVTLAVLAAVLLLFIGLGLRAGAADAGVGYAVGSALPFAVFAFCGVRVRRLLPTGRCRGGAL